MSLIHIGAIQCSHCLMVLPVCEQGVKFDSEAWAKDKKFKVRHPSGIIPCKDESKEFWVWPPQLDSREV